MNPFPRIALLLCCWCRSRTASAFLVSRHVRRPSQRYQGAPTKSESESSSSKVRILNKIGFLRTSKDNFEVHKVKKQKTPQRYNVTTLDELEAYWADEDFRFRNERGEINYDALLRSLNVQGDTQVIGSREHSNYTHPVAQLVHERKRNQSRPTINKMREDGCRIALAIEGGGMRGCISAGMICALHHLNMSDAFDVIYGSSAGTIIGSYLITGQLPWFGPEVYYDCLTTAGRQFIDTRRLLRALGFGLLDPRLFKDVLTRPRDGKPVLNLHYLLEKTLQQKKPLDWNKFVEKQKVQPLKIVASGCRSERALVLDMENRGFESLAELSECMHASCLLPGIAGPLMNLDKRALEGGSKRKKFVVGNKLNESQYEPLADALLFEPLPYREAVKDGATHVLVVRSRPDGTDVTGKGGWLENLIFRRFFLRKNRLPNMFERLRKQLHKKLYAEQIIELNDATRDNRDYKDTSSPHLMAIALSPGSKEVTRLETGREAIFDGVRRGFARAYDCLVEDPAERGRGAIVARHYFPDEILDYDPFTIETTNESAFSAYMREQGVLPKAWALASSEPEQLI